MSSPTVHDALDPDPRHDPRHDAAAAAWRPTGAMTIEHAATLWADAMSHLASTNGHTAAASVMRVDLSAVERLDTAGCQILIACREEARRRDLDWRLTGCTAQSLDVMRLLGCASPLGATDARDAADARNTADAADAANAADANTAKDAVNTPDAPIVEESER